LLWVLSILFAIFCVPICLTESVFQATYFSELRGYGYFVCSVLFFALSASLVYRTRLESDSDRPRILLAVSSALLVLVAVVLESQIMFWIGRLVFESRRR